MMKMYSGNSDTKTAKKIAGILSDLITEIGNGSEVHLDLSEEMRDTYDRRVPCYLCQPTGNMTLVVKWKRSELDNEAVIDEEEFGKIAKEVEEEMGYSNFTGTIYEEFALRVTERYIEEVEQ